MVIHFGIIQNLFNMKCKYFILFIVHLFVGGLVSCKTDFQIDFYSEDVSPLVGEYADVVIPFNIAPLNFFVSAEDGEEALVFSCEKMKLSAICKEGAVIPELDTWKTMLEKAKGKTIKVEHCVNVNGGWKAYKSFEIHVAQEEIDPYMVYRLIPPGYEMWDEMGIYQRNLENFDESVIVDNKNSDYNCMNCHSFCMQDPKKMMFHSRAVNAGTILLNDGQLSKLETKTDQTISSFTYPHWHPNGKFIAYSVNTIKQNFHVNSPNRIEVVDMASDIVVYDIDKNEVITSPLLFDKNVFETFPAFSPDGKTLYYCSAEAKNPIPNDFDEIRYHLCSISFDPSTRSFGKDVDTLFLADKIGKSVSFPRISPDGKRLLITLSDYGNFSIWHQEADLWMINLETKHMECMDVWNSESVESYHSWSSNSRWVVFSSRRMDGLYTRPYIAYIGRDNRIVKPFVLPQKRGSFYSLFLNSFNIPEMVKSKVEVSRRELLDKLFDDKQLKVVPRI